MEILKKDELLYVKAGLLYPEYKLNIEDIVRWEFIAEENEATYFSFIYKSSTQHISIPKMKPDELLKNISYIESVLKQPAKLIISESRITSEERWIVMEVSFGLLALILSTAKF